MAVFGFESICLQEDKIHDTDTTAWIAKHHPKSVSISSNLIEQAIFLSTYNPAALVKSFFDALDGLATQIKERTKLKFLEIDTSVKTKLNQTVSSLNDCCCRSRGI